MAGAFTGLFHLVFGKRGPSRAKFAPAPKPPAAPTAPGASSADAAPPAPAPQIFEAPTPVAETAPEPTAPEPTSEVVAAEPQPAEAPVAEAAPSLAESPAEPAPPSAEAESPPTAPIEPAPPVAEAEPTAPAEPTTPTAEAEPRAEAPPVAEEAEPPEPAPAEPAPPSAIDPSMKLSAHFTLEEFIRSATAKERKISNLPTEEHLANLRVAAAGMEHVRALLGGQPIQVTSGYRSEELNIAVKGSKTSDHLEGFSIDFGRPGMSHYDVAHAIASDAALMATVDQLIYEKGRWVHISFAPRLKQEVLTAYLKPETGERIHYIGGLHRVDEHGRLIPDA